MDDDNHPNNENNDLNFNENNKNNKSDNKRRTFSIKSITSDREYEFEVRVDAQYEDIFNNAILELEEMTIIDTLPLSTYYYETLELLLSNSSIGKKIDSIICTFKERVNEIFYFCLNRERCSDADYKSLKQQIYDISKIIAEIPLDDDTYFDLENIAPLMNLDKLKENKNFSEWEEQNKAELKKLKRVPCIAIAFPEKLCIANTANCFYSLSGAGRDYCDKNKELAPIYTKNKNDKKPDIQWGYHLEKEYEIANALIEKVFGFKFTPCHLTPQTERYTILDTILRDNEHKTNQLIQFDGRTLTAQLNSKMTIKNIYVL